MTVTDSEILEWVHKTERIEKASKAAPSKVVKPLARKHRGEIQNALLPGLLGLEAAVYAAMNQPDPSNVGDVLNSQVTTSPSFLSRAINNIYSPAGIAGIGAALILLRGVRVNPQLTSLQQGTAGIVSGINQTSLSLAEAAVLHALANGLPSSDALGNAQSSISSPYRADLIATTEADRGYNAGVLGAIVASGATQFLWIVTSDDACPLCLSLEGVHDITDDVPPQHPGCACYITPVPKELAALNPASQ